MKKLLMISIILLMGTLSYAGSHTDLAQDGTGSTSLSLKTTGNVVDLANSTVLVITPTRSIGATGDSLEFNFGTLMSGASSTLIGKFQAQVISDSGGTRKYGQLKEGNTNGNIKVGLIKDGNTKILKDTITTLAYNNSGSSTDDNSEIATLTYTLTPASRVTDSGKTYEGEIESTIVADDTLTGTFFDRSVSVAVQVTNIELK